MPNWCSSAIYFYSKDEAAIRGFKDKLIEIYNAGATVENGFGNGWLGDYVNTLLGPEYHTDTDNNPRCRGSLEFYDELPLDKRDGNWCFHIHTETAWGPMTEMWQLILEKHYPQISIAFSAEECGMAVYIKHDPNSLFFDTDNFYIEYEMHNDYESDYYDTLDGVINRILEITELGLSKEQFLGKNAEEVAEIADKAAKLLNEDNWFSVHEFEEVELDEAE